MGCAHTHRGDRLRARNARECIPVAIPNALAGALGWRIPNALAGARAPIRCGQPNCDTRSRFNCLPSPARRQEWSGQAGVLYSAQIPYPGPSPTPGPNWPSRFADLNPPPSGVTRSPGFSLLRSETEANWDQSTLVSSDRSRQKGATSGAEDALSRTTRPMSLEFGGADLGAGLCRSTNSSRRSPPASAVGRSRAASC